MGTSVSSVKVTGSSQSEHGPPISIRRQRRWHSGHRWVSVVALVARRAAVDSPLAGRADSWPREPHQPLW